MGYTLRIGEATILWDEDFVRIDVEAVKLDDAPAFGDPTDYTNSRWPSYSGWAGFCEQLRIADVMFNKRNGGAGEFEWEGKHFQPLLDHHPGACPVTKAHLGYVEQRLAEYKRLHPDHRAEYRPPKPGAKPLCGDDYREEDLVDDPRYDSTLCRAEWLVFWLRWAIANCQRPVFVNS